MHTADIDSYDPTDAINLWFNHGSRIRRVNQRDKNIKKFKGDYDIVDSADSRDDTLHVVSSVYNYDIVTLHSDDTNMTDNSGSEETLINTNIDIVPVVEIQSTQSVNADENAAVNDEHEYYYSGESSDNYETDSDLEEETVFSRLINFEIEMELD